VRLSAKKGACTVSTTPSPTGNPGEAHQTAFGRSGVRLFIRSWACGPPKVMKIAFGRRLLSMEASRSPGSSLNPNNRSQMEAPPSPCHPERSRGTCSSTDLSGKCISVFRQSVAQCLSAACKGRTLQENTTAPGYTSRSFGKPLPVRIEGTLFPNTDEATPDSGCGGFCAVLGA
jgi:hypothetical protein